MGDKLYETAKDIALEKQQALKASVAQSTKISPDEAARLARLSSASGVPVNMLERNGNDKKAEQRVLTSGVDYERIASENPNVFRFLANPNNAAIARGDYDSLLALEKNHSTTTRNSAEKGLLNVALQGDIATSLIDRGISSIGSAFLPEPMSGQGKPSLADMTRQSDHSLGQVAQEYSGKQYDARMNVAAQVFNYHYDNNQGWRGTGEMAWYLAKNPLAVKNFLVEQGIAAAPGLFMGGAAAGRKCFGSPLQKHSMQKMI